MDRLGYVLVVRGPLMVRHLPNLITLFRALLTPPLTWLLLERKYDAALLLFGLAAASDAADGLIARRWNLHTRFGAIADPLADKLTTLAVVLVLAWQAWLPWWFALLAIGRDIVIVAGALAYHLLVGRVDMAPSWLSKLNTLIEFVFLASVLAVAGDHFPKGPWFAGFLFAVSATIVASGTSYVIEWSRKAIRARAGHPARKSAEP